MTVFYKEKPQFSMKYHIKQQVEAILEAPNKGEAKQRLKRLNENVNVYIDMFIKEK